MKKGYVVVILSFLLIIFLAGAYSYSKYTTELEGDANVSIAKWKITVNGCPVEGNTSEGNCGKEETSEDGTTYTVDFAVSGDDVTYLNSNNNVRPGAISPGSDGTFLIRIKPNDTDVTFRYQITFGALDTEADIDLKYNGSVLTSSSVIEGIVNLSDFSGNADYEIPIEIEVLWNYYDDDEHNKKDAELGMRDSSKLLIPINAVFTQVK